MDDVAREYGRRRPSYERIGHLARELILQALAEHHVDFSSVDLRIKSLESLFEKCGRRGYTTPFEATDIVGIRVVYLYKSDLPLIRGLLAENFVIIDEQRHGGYDIDVKGYAGYAATHFLVRTAFPTPYTAQTPVEIQSRTVGQDAWAKLGYRMLYKGGAQLPEGVRRRVVGLSALYELADNRFDELRNDVRAHDVRTQGVLV